MGELLCLIAVQQPEVQSGGIGARRDARRHDLPHGVRQRVQLFTEGTDLLARVDQRVRFDLDAHTGARVAYAHI
ncbi:hypothetical protein AU194_24190 [Mycobacterium sp. GA-2829]|nr:hypothetical protein AU194_24190 [Mycobacterium sp. GA-2829]